MQAQREDDVKMQGADGRLQAKERGLEQILPSRPSEETNPATTFILGFQPPELWENKLLLFRPPNLWYVAVAALATDTSSCKLISLTLYYCIIKYISYLFSFSHHQNVNFMKAGSFAYFVL